MEFIHVSELEQKSFMNMMTEEVDEMYLKWNEWDIATDTDWCRWELKKEICVVTLPQGLVSDTSISHDILKMNYLKLSPWKNKVSMILLLYHLADCPATALGFYKFEKHLGSEHQLQNVANKWRTLI